VTRDQTNGYSKARSQGKKEEIRHAWQPGNVGRTENCPLVTLASTTRPQIVNFESGLRKNPLTEQGDCLSSAAEIAEVGSRFLAVAGHCCAQKQKLLSKPKLCPSGAGGFSDQCLINARVRPD